MANEVDKVIKELWYPISELADSIIEIENSIEDDGSSLIALDLLHKTHRLLLDNFIGRISSGPYGYILIEDVFAELEKRDCDISPLVMFYLAKYLMNGGSNCEEALPFLSKSLEYSITSKHPIDSPVDVAFTHAAVSYLSNKKNASEIDKLYSAAIELISDSGSFNSIKQISGLDLFILFAFIVKEKANLDMIHEFCKDECDIRDADPLFSVEHNFLNYAYENDLSNKDISELHLVKMIALYIEEVSLDELSQFYEDKFHTRDDVALGSIPLKSLEDVIRVFFDKELLNTSSSE
jgi:hypothetical protein